MDYIYESSYPIRNIKQTLPSSEQKAEYKKEVKEYKKAIQELRELRERQNIEHSINTTVKQSFSLKKMLKRLLTVITRRT